MPRTTRNSNYNQEAEAKPDKDEEVIDNDPEEVEVDDEEEEVEYEEVEEEEEVIEEEEDAEEVVEEEINEGTAIDNDIKQELKDGTSADVQRQEELLALPPHGSEVYLGGLPSDVLEDDLKSLCEPIGQIAEIRIPRGKETGDYKGFAFVSFLTKELAAEAIEKLNGTEFKGKKIKCSKSQVNHRLFIGNVPRGWKEDDIKKMVTEVGPGVTSVEMLKDPNDSSRNRGFAFIEYYNHACAEYARKKMCNPEFKLDDNAPTVSWAEPKTSGSASSSQVKAVYIKNLPGDVTQDQVKRLFEHHGKVTKVVLPPAKSGHEDSRFGFVHFAERSSAMKALKNTEKYEINGQVLECSLAKPHSDSKASTTVNSQKPSLLPGYPPRVGYSLLGSPYGNVGGRVGASSHPQPVVLNAPPGMAMLPMLLPDGRVGYVLQQAQVQPQGSSAVSHGSRSGGKQSNDKNRDRRRKPY